MFRDGKTKQLKDHDPPPEKAINSVTIKISFLKMKYYKLILNVIWMIKRPISKTTGEWRGENLL